LCIFVNGIAIATDDGINLEFIIAGVKHNDSLLKTAKGHFIMQPIHTKFARKVLPIPPNARIEKGPRKVFFAFDGQKIRSDLHSDFSPDGGFAIFDGKKQIEIGGKEIEISHLVEKNGKLIPVKKRGRQIGVRGRLAIDGRNRLRYWGLTYFKQPLGEYLEKNAIAILGKETIDKPLCYVIQAKQPRRGTMKFWIAPEQGFRVLKRESELLYMGGMGFVTATNRMKVVYQKLQDGIWCPKSAVEELLVFNKTTGKQELAIKYTLAMKNVKVNIDVSDLFKLDIPPETIVFDFRVGTTRTAKEAGIATDGNLKK